MAINGNKVLRGLWVILFAAAVFLSAVLPGSCASVAQSPVANAPVLLAWFGGAGTVRGSLVDAVPLSVVSAGETAAYLTPLTLSALIKPDLLVKAGFFEAVKSLQPGFSLVRQIRIHYWSIDLAGRPVQLSGLLMVPALAPGEGKEVPLLLLCHGTQLLRERVPSRLGGSERLVGMVAAASGMAVVLPDYPGLGDSEGFHPYCEPESLAHAGVDSLRAARNWLKLASKGSLVESPRVFVAGYSEGGYAAMATLKELQIEAKAEFALEAGWPMAIPADMSGTMRRMMCGTDPVDNPYYLLYTLLGWRSGNPDLFSPEKLLAPGVIKDILPLMDGLHPASEVNQAIARFEGVAPGKAVASSLLSPWALKALENPGEDPEARAFVAALLSRDLADWPADPEVPLYLAASPIDRLVPPVNSDIVKAAMTARGVPVTLHVLSPNTHADAGIEAYALMLLELWQRTGKISAVAGQ